MKKFTCILLPFCLALSGIITGCSQNKGPGIDVLEIEGVSWACNVTTSYGWFGSNSESEEQDIVLVTASEGDMIYMTKDDLQVYYRYNSKDGSDLAFTFDTLHAHAAFLNGKLNYLELSGSSSPAAWEAWSVPELEQLSTLCIKGHPEDDFMSNLEGHAVNMQGIGLVLEDVSESTTLKELLSLCRPDFLVLDDSYILPEPEEIFPLDGLELLWLQEGFPMLSKTVGNFKRLESLIVSEWDPQPGELLMLSSLPELQNLTLADSDLNSLQSIVLPKSLQSLNLILCDTLTDIESLQDLPELYRLNLTACNRVNTMSILQNLESLRWISFPSSITQEEFHKLAGSLSHMEVAELYDCQQIKNLLPLQQMEQLKVLTLYLQQNQLNGLDSLTHLDVLILTDELINDNEVWIKELRASLPQSRIVPGSGMCLGSGWLLMLLPLILLCRFSFRQKA